MPPTTPRPPRTERLTAWLGDRERVLTSLLLGLPVLVWAALGWQRRWLSDDGFISLRVVLNLASGHGMVFNRGERVEASTSTLWVLLLWLAHVVSTAPITTVAIVLGILCGTAGLATATVAARRLRRVEPGDGLVWLPLAGVVVLALPPMWDYLTSGLETGLTLGWLGGSWWMVVRAWDGGRLWPAALAAGLGPLVRPDDGLYTVAFLVTLLAIARPTLRSRGGVLLLTLLPGLAYEIFRAGYFAALVPNTALAKSAASSQWSWGGVYLWDYAGRYWLVLPLLVIGACLVGERRAGRLRPGAGWIIVPILVAGALHTVYVVFVGGDFMHGRFLVPATFALLMPVAAVPFRLAGRGRDLAPVLAFATLLAWACYSGVFARPALMTQPTRIADERAPYVYGADLGWLGDDFARRDGAVALGASLEQGGRDGNRMYWDLTGGETAEPAPGYTIVVRNIFIGHLSYGGPDIFIADQASLADPIGARLVLPLPPTADRRVGHNQIVPQVWHRAMFTAVTQDEPADLVDARAVLECGEIAELRDAIRDPMTVGRFLANLRLAVPLTRMTIPVDPIEARAEFCHED